MRITFQNMFPAINVQTMKLADCGRVVLFNYNQVENQTFMKIIDTRSFLKLCLYVINFYIIRNLE